MVSSPVPVFVSERARLVLAHAAIQSVADRCGADVLHIKGYALAPTLQYEGRVSTDVDVLVRPQQAQQLITALGAAGWRRYHGFETGSPFEHAYTLVHETWGFVDVHRHFPGVTVNRSDAFARLWDGRVVQDFAGVAAAVPSLTAQRLIMVLHAARLTDRARAARDVAAAWTGASDDEQSASRRLVAELGAEVAFAAAVGGLEAYRDRPEYLLWKVQSRGGTRMEEWWARVRASETFGEKVRLVVRALLVNVEHLAVVLGHRPSAWEIAREFFARPARGAREEWRRWRRRRGRR